MALAELRDRLSAEIGRSPSPSALAALGRELRSTLVELAGLRSGDVADLLVRLQNLAGLLSAAMDAPGTSPAAVAALGREVRAVLAELNAHDDSSESTGLAAELRERRRLRLEAARAELEAKQAAEVEQ